MRTLKIKATLTGRVVSLGTDGMIYVGQRYGLWACDSSGSGSLLAQVPRSIKRRLIEPSRLLCRLLRHEIRAFKILSDGTKVVATRKGLYYGDQSQIQLHQAKIDGKGPLPIKPPATMMVDSSERIFWGEYWGNPNARPVQLFASHDKGRSYQPFYQFKAGEIKHVHNIVEDPHDNCYWVLAGDHFEQSGIGRLSKDLQHFDWLVKGEQKYRTTYVFPLEDRIVYAMDSEKEPDHICSLDKATGKWRRVCDIPGSSTYSARFGRWYVITTAAERFDYETPASKMATMWVSNDCETWQQILTLKKDIWPKTYFQFGLIILPRGLWDSDTIVFSGLALKQYDNVVCIADIIEE